MATVNLTPAVSPETANIDSLKHMLDSIREMAGAGLHQRPERQAARQIELQARQALGLVARLQRDRVGMTPLAKLRALEEAASALPVSQAAARLAADDWQVRAPVHRLYDVYDLVLPGVSSAGVRAFLAERELIQSITHPDAGNEPDCASARMIATVTSCTSRSRRRTASIP